MFWSHLCSPIKTSHLFPVPIGLPVGLCLACHQRWPSALLGGFRMGKKRRPSASLPLLGIHSVPSVVLNTRKAAVTWRHLAFLHPMRRTGKGQVDRRER